MLDDHVYEICQEWFEEAGIQERKYKRRAVIRVSNVLINSTLDDHRISLCLVGIVQENLDSGRLIRPFELSITGRCFYYFVYPEKALRNLLVRLFKTWLFKEVRKAESRAPFQESL